MTFSVFGTVADPITGSPRILLRQGALFRHSGNGDRRPSCQIPHLGQRTVSDDNPARMFSDLDFLLIRLTVLLILSASFRDDFRREEGWDNPHQE